MPCLIRPVSTYLRAREILSAVSHVTTNMPTDSKLHLRVASPCKAPWENMDGDDRVRFCRACNRNVYNLSAMTSREARRVVTEREGRLCVRFYQRRDGTVLATDCPVAVKRSFLRASTALIMGDIAVPPEPPLMGRISGSIDEK